MAPAGGLGPGELAGGPFDEGFGFRRDVAPVEAARHPGPTVRDAGAAQPRPDYGRRFDAIAVRRVSVADLAQNEFVGPSRLPKVQELIARAKAQN